MTYRNKKLLAAANGAPCQYCGTEDGTTVAAHSNQLRDGKGTGHKSADYRVAYVCAHCHDAIDGRFGARERDVKVAMWESAHRRTVAYLFENGIVGTK